MAFMSYKEYFKDKKITIMGLGLLGRGIGVTKFLAECGADLIVTDLKTEEQLAKSLKQLAKFKNIKFVLGEHQLEDFKNRDLIIKAAGVPLDSPFVVEARKNKIPVEMDASLFARLAPEGVKIVGITGTRGKSTVTHLIYEILKNAFGDKHIFLGGNVRGLATLPLLKKVKSGDIVVMELDSWQLQGFGDSKISPQVALFTTFLRDHQNYYKDNMELYFADKANIYRYQKREDILIARPQSGKFIKENDGKNIKGRFKIAKKSDLPIGWKIKMLGEHNLENIALAVAGAKELGVSEKIIKKTVEEFKGVPGRMEFIREVGGIKYYNDTTATTPDGVIAALSALKKYDSKIVLIGGGSDKSLVYDEYTKAVKKSVKALVLFKGLATDKILEKLDKAKFPANVVDKMKDAVVLARDIAQKGDIILLSPGATSFGIFKNEFDRGDQFNNLVNKIK